MKCSWTSIVYVMQNCLQMGVNCWDNNICCELLSRLHMANLILGCLVSSMKENGFHDLFLLTFFIKMAMMAIDR